MPDVSGRTRFQRSEKGTGKPLGDGSPLRDDLRAVLGGAREIHSAQRRVQLCSVIARIQEDPLDQLAKRAGERRELLSQRRELLAPAGIVFVLQPGVDAVEQARDEQSHFLRAAHADAFLRDGFLAVRQREAPCLSTAFSR